MHLVVISHKPCWADPISPSNYVTDGGFPFQMEAISELFDRTTLVVPVCQDKSPSGTHPLVGHNLSVQPLDQPVGHRWRRKISLIPWLPMNLLRIWRAVQSSDAVHTPMGGDVGTFGVLIALVQKKPLFVRYCGLWGQSETVAQRFWHWLLVKIAGGRNVVLATGSGDDPPSLDNPHIEWIFATSMREAEMDAIPAREPWQAGKPLKLITVGRQEPGKNTDRVIQALPMVRERYPRARLDVVGDGSCLPTLKRLAEDLNVAGAVTFHGKVDHDAVIGALIEAHVFCFPTDSEGFPKAVHEALACGLPVITTPVSVLRQLIGDQNGVLLKDIQPQTITQAILDLIANEQRFAEMIHSAQQTAQAYSLEAWRDQIGQKLIQAWGPLRDKGGSSHTRHEHAGPGSSGRLAGSS